MRLVVGLGNPGPRYRATRHNLGFMVVDVLASRCGVRNPREEADAWVAESTLGGEPALLVKPLTFMNLSGQAIQGLVHFHKIEVPDLLVIADDANLPLGRLRARRGGSAGGHNGFKSVAQHLGTDQFPRLRIGVGRGDGRRDLADHVLSRFDAEERATIDETIALATDAAEVFVTEGIDAVMRRFNADPARAGDEELPEDAGSEKDSQS